MTQERIVTLESAKKLKLLGFNELCDNCNKSLNESVITFDLKGFHNSMKGVIARPTQSHVQRWLFKRGYFVSVSFAFKEFDLNAEDVESAKMLHYLVPEVYAISQIYSNLYERIFINTERYDKLKTYEDVLEDAIGLVLDFMLKKKQEIENENRSNS